MKNVISEMPLITLNLSISNLRTTSAKPMNVRTIKKLVEYSLKSVVGKDNVYFSRFRRIAVLGRSVL